jgi:hypothetical protein
VSGAATVDPAGAHDDEGHRHTVDSALVDYARRVVADAPALSAAQLDRIVSVFNAGRAA